MSGFAHKEAGVGSILRLRGRATTPGHGAFKVALAALIWGSMGVLIRLVDLPPVVIVFWRALFATTALLIVVVATGRTRHLIVRKYKVLLPMTGVFLLMSMVFFAKAVRLTTVANAILTVYTAPVIIALLAPVFLRERFAWQTLAALVLAIAGMGLILGPQGLAIGGKDALGIAYAGVCAVGYAFAVLVGKRVVAVTSSLAMTFYQCAVITLILAVPVLRYPLPPSSPAWIMLGVLGVVHTALAGMIYLGGLREVKAQEAGILAYLEPLSAAVYAMIFLGEPLTLWVVAGGSLIVAAGWLVMRVRPPEVGPVPV